MQLSRRSRRSLVPVAVVAVVLAGTPTGPGVGPAVAREVADGGRAPCSSGQVSLSFDDGPSPRQTPRLLDILRRENVPATFFVVGQRVAAAPALTRRIETAGFLVANHSYAHVAMTSQTSAAVQETLRATDRRLRAAGVHPTRLMRPPYGAINDRVRTAIARTGHIPVLWDIDSADWTGLSSAAIASRVLGGLRPGSSNVVLQHDGVGNSPASISAVPRIVSEARRRGYCFVALDEQGRPGFPTPRADVSVTGGREGEHAVATVSLDKPAGREVRVRLRVRARTARPGQDYTKPGPRLVIPAGSLRASVRIPLLRDRLDEARERADVLIDRPVGVRLGRARAVLVIADRTGEPGITGIDRTVVEPAQASEETGASGESVTVPVRFRLARVSGRDVRIRVRSQPGTATPGEDVDPVDTTITIPAGTRTAQVPITVHPDALDEPEERFKLRIVEARFARILGHAVVTITPPPVPPEPEPDPDPNRTPTPSRTPSPSPSPDRSRPPRPRSRRSRSDPGAGLADAARAGGPRRPGDRRRPAGSGGGGERLGHHVERLGSRASEMASGGRKRNTLP